METIQLLPLQNNNIHSIFPIQYTEPIIIDITEAKEVKYVKNFIEANTQEIDLFSLKNDCIIPVFSKDNELTISHYNFIETMWNAVNIFFPSEPISKPEIRVSHVIKGRIPEAIHKPINELLETDKTIYYERMAFCIEVPSIYQIIDGNRLNLTVGGVRAYNHENLYSKKTYEKFKIFIGFRNLVCCNLCISTDGYQSELRVMSELELEKAILALFKQYNVREHLEKMSNLQNVYLSEHQFAQLIGKSKLYHCLPNRDKKLLPIMEFGDTHINTVAKAYYNDENFRIDEGSNAISLWKVYNLFTTANKSSYIDNLLDRSLNATDLAMGINKALNGDSEYRWFIE
ncbi:DUF3871 family protein [Dysgonomonas sp. Marseille-P4361]|uniref:DUF3871 family protein n=1 Tax=Dysgonomonas sp. Marseille-P4361 TaxID=2161820 RepID=UPI000D55180A|nr:DUF3871 family protein [Dysgonomonas sp. Marseille-P4361]